MGELESTVNSQYKLKVTQITFNTTKPTHTLHTCPHRRFPHPAISAYKPVQWHVRVFLTVNWHIASPGDKAPSIALGSQPRLRAYSNRFLIRTDVQLSISRLHILYNAQHKTNRSRWIDSRIASQPIYFHLRPYWWNLPSPCSFSGICKSAITRASPPREIEQVQRRDGEITGWVGDGVYG